MNVIRFRSLFQCLIFCIFTFCVVTVNGGKLRKLIDFLDKDAPNDIEKMPNYNEESVAFQRDKKFNPCLENPNLCSNGGKCLHEGGNFYCVCPVTHYGKICEHLADPTNCENHLCQNNSTCVSTKEKRTLVNTVLLHSLRASKGAEQLTDAELNSLDVMIQYECICQRGTFGAFCDESNEDRICQEVHCLGRGKGKSVNGSCTCQCEKQFFGERCEQLSACFDAQCENGGICEDVVDWQQKTVTANCKCPDKVEVINGMVSGENCEKLEIPAGVDPKYIPCQEGGNADQFYEDLTKKTNIDDALELHTIQQDYHDGVVEGKRMAGGWCENEGKCIPQVIRAKSNLSFYIPSCECTNPLSDGVYCEYLLKDACSLSRDEVARGAQADEKCTDSTHGSCIDKFGEAVCDCQPDYTGESCEVFDPCARHPCKHGDCIPIPSSADTAFGTDRYQCLCPLSAKLSPDNDCIPIASGVCKKGSCGNGRCVPCESDDVADGADDDLMALCNANEKAQGFRCLCEAGYLPPKCNVHTNPCFQNLCQNSATCKVTKHKSYDCICLNGTRGTLCEIIDDSCDAFGNNVCENGLCVNDDYFHRGFSCQCDEDFEGMNCDVELSRSRAMYKKIMKHYHLTLPLSVCLVSLLILLAIIMTSSIKSRRQSLGEVDAVPISMTDA